MRIECVQPGASLVKVHTTFVTEPLHAMGGEEGDLKEGAVVQIADLFAGEKKDLLLELKVPQLPEGAETESTELIKARVRYYDMAQKGTVETSFVALELERRAGGTAAEGDEQQPQPEMEPDEEVADHRERVEVTNALELCIAECERENFTKAQELIQGRKKQLAENCARRKKGRTPMLEALAGELEDAERRVSSSSAFNAGGRAEMSDAMNMHRRQRVTTQYVNASVGLGDVERGAELRASKAKSKGMYMNSVQSCKVAKSIQHR